MRPVGGNKHPCDYGSRHPDPIPEGLTKEELEDWGIETEETDREIWVNRIMEDLIPAITLEELKDATKNDAELGPYGKIWDEIQERDGLLIKGDQIVVP